MNVLRGWLEQWLSWDRRNSERQSLQGLIAYYWTGAVSVGKAVRDISPKGLYMLTEDRWYPGTMIRITLQKTGEVEKGSTRSITLQAKVVRSDSDGVGFAFILPQAPGVARQERRHAIADEETVERFLSDIKTDKY